MRDLVTGGVCRVFQVGDKLYIRLGDFSEFETSHESIDECTAWARKAFPDREVF